jgi:Icc-related predicted phosphoesterase
MQSNIKQNQKLCLFTSDIHGNVRQYEKILKIAKKDGIKYIFFGGDLLPKDGGLWNIHNTKRTIKYQKKFIKNYFNNYLLQLSKSSNIYLIFGNDDFASCEKTITKKSKKIHLINNKCIKITKEISIYGYPYIQLTPFQNKDWEKWDSKKTIIDESIVRLKGYWSKGNNHIPVDYSILKNEISNIKDDLAKIAKKYNPQKTIFLFHQPPYGKNLDMIEKSNKWFDGDIHIGSKSIRDFINKHKPLLTLHGHIHETVLVSKKFIEKPPKTYSVTAGNNYLSDKVSYIIFSLDSFSHFVRV